MWAAIGRFKLFKEEFLLPVNFTDVRFSFTIKVGLASSTINEI